MIRVLLLAQTVASTARGAGTPGGRGRDVSGLVGAAGSALVYGAGGLGQCKASHDFKQLKRC